MFGNESGVAVLRVFQCSAIGALLLLLRIAMMLPAHSPILVDAIRCFCTDEHCVPYGSCEANICLVGILRANNAVIRTCGNEPVGCQRSVGKWSDLCACDNEFCNTLSYLRANSFRDRENRNNQYDDSDLVFQRVDPPLGDFSNMFDEGAQDNSPLSSKTSLLTLLLVIVPLSVGAATVLVVAFNYYCHLC